jgi:3-isopropylmalate/(R)-2-methylmalate dehydratase small subunit
MNPVTQIEGTMVPLHRADIDTDQIIPQQFLKRIERTGYGAFLFDSWARETDGTPRPDFVLNDPERRNAKVLVTGANFGCGSSREHAVWAIQDRGFEAVVAPSFADIFRNNAVNVGLLPVTAEAGVVDRLIALAASPGAEVAIDLDGQTLEADGVVAPFTIDPESRHRLLNGLDPIAETLQMEDGIAAFEAQRPGWVPSARL